MGSTASLALRMVMGMEKIKDRKCRQPDTQFLLEILMIWCRGNGDDRGAV